MYHKKDWYMFTILLNLTVSIMYTFDNMELKYGPLVLMLSSSLCMYSLENRAQPEVFTNAFSGIWWAASTLLTVGYGDIYPVTTIGKIFGIFIAFLGVGMVAIPTGIISAGFVDQYSRLKRIGEYGQEEDVHFIRIRLTENDQWVNHRIMELNMPERIIIAVIQRNHRSLSQRAIWSCFIRRRIWQMRMIWRFNKSAIDVFLVLMLQFFRPKHSVDFSG